MTSLFLDENPKKGDRMSPVLDQIQVNHGTGTATGNPNPAKRTGEEKFAKSCNDLS